MENCKIGFAFDTQCFMKSWKVRQVTEFLFKCCQQLSQIMVQFGFIWRNLHLIFINWEASLTLAYAWSPLSAIWSSIIQNIFNHKIFSCAPNIFMPNRKNIFSPPMDQIIFLKIWTDKSWINSQRTDVSNNGKILWKISFWLFSPDKAESKASEEEVRNFFRLSTSTSQPWTPSSILTRMSL